MNFFQRIVLRGFNILYPYKIYGKENVPKGACVFICNHFRAIDPAFICDVYSKDVYFLAKKELFKNKLFGKIIKSLGALPIDRENIDLKSMLGAIKILKNGHKLTIFPEGTRNKTGTNELQELKGGSALFAIKAKCPIVPIMMYSKARLFRKTKLIVGKPFELSEYYDKKLGDSDFEEINAIIRDKMLFEMQELKKITEKKNGSNKR